ncbi:MAG: A/G-specific adenine glycosylase [Acidobacteria bacterium]|nr:A/G-specific adenine glycosylase [Acidobacteriota bacterium]MBI3655936.1 A/G-specific adenine glycosylase [Acidobacteriota bacterium]
MAKTEKTTRRARPAEPLSPVLRKRLAARLLDWYSRNQRDLPWRRTQDPYAIWVSEVMLQQTQVDQVVPYYQRFMNAFPTMAALADAPRDAVLKVWEGMGYYSRARNLHETARRIVEKHDGQFPTTYESVRDLPGLGAYTAGSVLSIAFNQPFPAVDGNVQRVLSRVFRIESDPRKTPALHQITTSAQALIPKGKARDFNQALMEIGALVCRPQPKCEVCCWSNDCRAYQEMPDPAILPLRAVKKPRPHYTIAVGVIWKGDHVLIARRASSGFLGDLWEFPGGKLEANESLEACCAREVREELGLSVDVIAPFMSLKHAYSHFSITLHAFYCRYRRGRPQPKSASECRWVSIGKLSDYAFPKANKVLIEVLQKQGRRPATDMRRNCSRGSGVRDQRSGSVGLGV